MQKQGGRGLGHEAPPSACLWWPTRGCTGRHSVSAAPCSLDDVLELDKRTMSGVRDPHILSIRIDVVPTHVIVGVDIVHHLTPDTAAAGEIPSDCHFDGPPRFIRETLEPLHGKDDPVGSARRATQAFLGSDAP